MEDEQSSGSESQSASASSEHQDDSADSDFGEKPASKKRKVASSILQKKANGKEDGDENKKNSTEGKPGKEELCKKAVHCVRGSPIKQYSFAHHSFF